MKKLSEIYFQVKRNFIWTSDKDVHGVGEHWTSYADDVEADKVFRGDCVWVEEEIYVKGGVKKVKALAEGDLVLSYDFEKQEFLYKPVVMVIEKGCLPCKEITLKNNYTITITEDHPLWARTNQGRVHGKKVASKYEKTNFSEIDPSKWWKRKMPIAKKIPYEITDIKRLSEDICFLLGHVLAEGWAEKKTDRYFTSGYEVDEYIIPILDANDIPYARHVTNSGVPYITFFKSPFREYLRPMVFNSFDIRVPEEIFHLPPVKIQRFMDGYFMGDGHLEGPRKQRKCYSTSCESFAKNLQRMALQCGHSLNGYKQECHQGVGTKPIWRVQHEGNATYRRHYGYADISEVGINYRKIKDAGPLPVRDFTIADTHTFVFKNGLISHQCDDFALTCAELLLREGYEPFKLSIDFCTTETGQGHLVCVYDGIVLDNRQRRPLPIASLSGYKWHSRMLLSEKGIWRKTRMVVL